MGAALEKLFGERTKAFLEDHWPEKAFRAQVPLDHLDGLMDLGFEALRQLPCAFVRAFMATQEGNHVIVGIAPEQVVPLYDAGHTIYFHGLRSPMLDDWRAALSRELGVLAEATRIAAFASRRSAGARAHYDLNDNIVVQLKGHKRWRLAPNEHVQFPTAGFTMGRVRDATVEAEAPHGMPPTMPASSEVVDLVPGTVMFMPRGMWHETSTIGEESLHINVQTGLSTWKDLLLFLVRETPLVSRAVELRHGVADLFVNGALRPEARAELKARLESVVAQIGDPDLATITERAFEQYVARQRGARV